jgi:PAS domain-containing protein
MESTSAGRNWQFAAVFAALTLALGLTRLYDHLLFHSLTELFAVAVAATTFILAWNTRRLLQNHYLLLVGIASLCVAAIDLVHTLSYSGMGVLKGIGPNTPTQLWIAGRYLESVSFLLAPLFLVRKLKPALALAICAAAAALLMVSVFAGVFPVCYVEGAGLTPFKIRSEYAVSAIFAASAVLLYRRRACFERFVYWQLGAAILLMTAAEAAFTLYSNVYGAANVAGHLLRFVADGLIYRAIVVTGLVRPYGLLFRELKRSEERYRAFIAGSAEGMCRIEVEGSVEAGLAVEEQVRRLLAGARIAECNDAFARMRGFENAAAVSGAPLAGVLDAFEPGAAALLEEFVRGGYRTDAVVAHERNAEPGRYIAGSLSGVVENGRLVRAWSIERDITERRLASIERDKLIADLRHALAEVKTLSGLLPICAHCKKVRDDQGYWTQVEAYLGQKTGVLFSHGICPDCVRQLYPGYTIGARLPPERPA